MGCKPCRANRRFPVKGPPKISRSEWTSQIVLIFKKMKKISLKNLDIQAIEKLSREQLRNVSGGSTDVTTYYYGGCIRCEVREGPHAGATSCYYSNEAIPDNLCRRVYPNQSDTGVGYPTECTPDCVLN